MIKYQKFTGMAQNEKNAQIDRDTAISKVARLMGYPVLIPRYI